MTEIVDDLIEKMIHAERLFRRACSQILVLNRNIAELQERYDISLKRNARTTRYTLRVRIAVMEGIRNMYYAFASKKADLIVELRREIDVHRDVLDAEAAEDESIYYDDDDELDLSDSELELSDWDYEFSQSELDGNLDLSDLSAIQNVSLQESGAVTSDEIHHVGASDVDAQIVADTGFTFPLPLQKRLVVTSGERISVNVSSEERILVKTDLNETDTSIDSGYMDDSKVGEEAQDAV